MSFSFPEPIIKIIPKKLNIDSNYGFVMIRHITTDRHNTLWLDNYNNIRKYYPSDIKIMIVDDNSSFAPLHKLDSQYLASDPNLSIYYISEHAPELLSCGEILGYYMFNKIRPFKYAIVIHDSAIINKYIDFQEISKKCECGIECIPIWMFDSTLLDNKDCIEILLNNLNNNDILWNTYKNQEKWIGCYGVMSVVSFDYIEKINKLFGILNTNFIKIIKTSGGRKMRCSMERIWGIIMSAMHNESYSIQNYGNHMSYFSDIISYFIINGYKCWYDNYNDYVNGIFDKLPIIKVWSGR